MVIKIKATKTRNYYKSLPGFDAERFQALTYFLRRKLRSFPETYDDFLTELKSCLSSPKSWIVECQDGRTLEVFEVRRKILFRVDGARASLLLLSNGKLCCAWATQRPSGLNFCDFWVQLRTTYEELEDAVLVLTGYNKALIYKRGQVEKLLRHSPIGRFAYDVFLSVPTGPYALRNRKDFLEKSLCYRFSHKVEKLLEKESLLQAFVSGNSDYLNVPLRSLLSSGISSLLSDFLEKVFLDSLQKREEELYTINSLEEWSFLETTLSDLLLEHFIRERMDRG